MKTIILASTIALTACGAPAPYRQVHQSNTPVDIAKRECDYEAEKATASIPNAFAAGWMQATVMRKCMASKGFSQ